MLVGVNASVTWKPATVMSGFSELHTLVGNGTHANLAAAD